MHCLKTWGAINLRNSQLLNYLVINLLGILAFTFHTEVHLIVANLATATRFTRLLVNLKCLFSIKKHLDENL